MSIPFILVVVVVVLAILLVAFFFSRDARIKRALRKSPRVTVEEFPGGSLARIVGSLRYVGEPLQAPLTGRSCAFYEVIVQEYRSSGKSGSWRTIIEDRDWQDFLVDDGTGVALVRVVMPDVAVVKDAHFRSGTFNDATPELEAYLATQGYSSTGLIGFNKSLRYREGALEEGESVAVAGLGRWEPDPGGIGGSYREMPKRLVLDAPAEGKLLASDDPAALGDRIAVSTS